MSGAENLSANEIMAIEENLQPLIYSTSIIPKNNM